MLRCLRVRILEWEPKDLDEALQLASRFEAYGKTTISTSMDGAEVERKRQRGRNLRAVNSGSKSTDVDDVLHDLTKKVAELQAAVVQCQQELKQRTVGQTEGRVRLLGTEVNRSQPPSVAPVAWQSPPPKGPPSRRMV